MTIATLIEWWIEVLNCFAFRNFRPNSSDQITPSPARCFFYFLFSNEHLDHIKKILLKCLSWNWDQTHGDIDWNPKLFFCLTNDRIILARIVYDRRKRLSICKTISYLIELFALPRLLTLEFFGKVDNSQIWSDTIKSDFLKNKCGHLFSHQFTAFIQ